MLAATTTKVCSFIFLLFGVLLLLGCNVQAIRSKVCPLYCKIDEGAYMICKSSGDRKLGPPCNCCLAQAGCKVYSINGTLTCTGS
ncbi:hypothetical protein CASFOL_016613 [Castilleja foliolosa]|uniref:Uncharacterized protein n=1 Tax=Castilleja foliolosa TaxID=1961234 RepID=A0ABD3D8R9_9LAMI